MLGSLLVTLQSRSEIRYLGSYSLPRTQRFSVHPAGRLPTAQMHPHPPRQNARKKRGHGEHTASVAIHQTSYHARLRDNDPLEHCTTDGIVGLGT